MKIDINKLTLKQRDNLSAALAAYEKKSVISSVRPVALYIELTKNCIARCEFCHADWNNDPQYTMSNETFEYLKREYVPYATYVDLRGYGESLMLDNFDSYVEQISPLCPHIRLTTTLGCGNKRALQSLVDHNVFISVSFDAADKKVYESTRKGICYDTVIRNMTFLSKEIQLKHGSLSGMMRIGIIPLQAHNLPYVDGVIDLAAQLGITEIRILPLGSHQFDLNTLFYHKRETVVTLLKAIKKARQNGVALQFGASLFRDLRVDEFATDRCCKPWLYSVINHEGRILYCDWHISPRDKSDFIGFVGKSDDSAWNGDKAKQVRSAHVSKSGLSWRCKSCYRLGKYSDHEHELDPQFVKWLVTDKEMEQRLLAWR